MRSCIRIPRITLPREDYEYWAIPPIDLLKREDCEKIMARAGEHPSLLGCTVPDFSFDGEDQEPISLMQKTVCQNLCENKFERLYRGAIYVERQTSRGLRRGILAMLDLEELQLPDSPVRFTTEVDAEIIRRRALIREENLLEFPHTVLLYRDKRDKTVRALKKDLELLYEIDLPLGGGNVSGFFIPDEDAVPLMRELMSRADPFFVVADGNHSLAAAKRVWDKTKASLSEEEQRHHPARFTLAEFVNETEESVFFQPLHRLVKEIETEAFCDYFQKHIKCKREKNILYPILSGPESYCEANAVIGEFVKQNFGKTVRTPDRPRAYEDIEDTVVVAFPAVEKGELFAAAKSGKKFPAKTFCLGAVTDARYSFEGREITYD